MRVTAFVSRVDTVRSDSCVNRRLPDVVLIEHNRAFDRSEPSFHVVPKVPDDELHSRVGWIEGPNPRRLYCPWLTHILVPSTDRLLWLFAPARNKRSA